MSDRPGMNVSVIDGAPSKKVCSGTIAAVGEGALTFSLGAFDFLGRYLDGCGLYAQRTGCSISNEPAAADERSSGLLDERPNEEAQPAVAATRRRETRPMAGEICRCWLIADRAACALCIQPAAVQVPSQEVEGTQGEGQGAFPDCCYRA